MKHFFIGALLLGLISSAASSVSASSLEDESIRKAEQSIVDSIKAHDVDGIMRAVKPSEDFVLFDVPPPRQINGAKAYRKVWEDWYANFAGTLEVLELQDVGVKASGSLGFSHAIQHFVIKQKDGKRFEVFARVTHVFEKVDGRWLLIHEHGSVPVDIATGRAEFTAKPAQAPMQTPYDKSS